MNGFVDEGEDFDYHNTHPNYDSEEDEEMLRFKQGSSHLDLGKLFDKIKYFKTH